MQFIRMIKWLLLFPFFLGLVVVSLLATEKGFQLIVELGDSLSGDIFSVERVEGRLFSAWRLEEVTLRINKNNRETEGASEYKENQITVEIDELACSWRVMELLRGTLHGEYIRVRGVRVWLAAEEEKNDVPRRNWQAELPEINLLVNLIVDDFRLDDLSIFSPSIGDGYDGYGEPFIIHELLMKAELIDGHLRVKRFKLDTPDFGGEFAGDLQFTGNWPLTLAGDWFAVAAGSDELSGSLGLRGDLEELTVSMQLEAPFTAEITGGVTSMLSDNLQWRFSGNTGEIILNDLGIELPVSGMLDINEVSGSLQTYQGVIAAEINYSDYPRVRVESSFAGDLSGVDISFFRLLVDQSVLTTVGRVDWGDGLSWQGNIKGEQIDPELFLAGWPGKIDLALGIRGKWYNDDLSTDLQLELLDGVLRGFPLAGTGRMELSGDELKFYNLLLKSGTTSLQVHGQAGAEFDLSFQAESEDMASLLPESRGWLRAEGKVHGSWDAPRIIFDLKGRELGFKEYWVREISAQVDLDLGGDGQLKAEVKGSGIGGATENYIDRVWLDLSGDLKKHTLVISAAGAAGGLDLSFTGTLKDEEWQGEIDQLQFYSPRFGQWQTEPAAALIIGRQQAKISDFFLRHEQLLFSLEGGWEQEKGWHIRSDLEDFSLQLLEDWGFAVPRFQGMVRAEFTAAGDGAVPDQVELVVSLPELVLTGYDEDGKVKKWLWPENNIDISIDDGEAQIIALSRFEDGCTGKLDIVVQNLDFSDYQPEEITLSGNLKTMISDISFIAPLSNYMLDGSGGLGGNARISGTVAAPVIHAEFSLVDGEVLVPAANISLDRLEFSARGDGRNNIVDILVSSGEGSISVAGAVNRIDDRQWQADLGIIGERFKMVNLAEYQVEISPAIRLLYNYQDGIHLSGAIIIPMAYIAPEEFQRVVTASADVVMVDSDGQKQQKTGHNLPLSFELDVISGEDVEINAFGLQGYLAGRLRLIGSPGKAVTALGNLQLQEGTFLFYDTTLEISRGLIFYQGGGVHNPGLDIRAEREVSGKEVGVLITGTASRMEFNLFSNPTMDNSDILSYMMTGRKMLTGAGGGEGAMLKAAATSLGIWPGGLLTDGLEGITGFDLDMIGVGGDGGLSLVVGKEIVDGLYISYGMNLADSLGTFRARYDLNRGLSLETESNAEETGVDLFWSWER